MNKSNIINIECGFDFLFFYGGWLQRNVVLTGSTSKKRLSENKIT